MTIDRSRHEAWEELVSAAVTGDVTPDERRRVEAHLADCATCRATWDAFVANRKIVGGLRHYAPPRDLYARVRGGIETGRLSRTPWWRRPPAIFAGVTGGLAVVAGALLGLVLLDSQQPEVGQATPTPIVSVAPTPSAEETPRVQPSPSVTPETPAPTPISLPPASPDPDATPAPDPTDPPALASSPEPDMFLALTGDSDNQALTFREGASGEPIGEAGTPAEAPIAASMTDDGEWLAFITKDQFRGLQTFRLSRLERPADDGSVEIADTMELATEADGVENPFLDRLDWSHDGRYLAYTVADPETGATDAWVFDTELGEPRQLTSTGNAFAGSFLVPRDPEDTTAQLWVSTAGETPMSYVVDIADGALEDWQPIDPAELETQPFEDVFQPLVSPNGGLVIYWNGRMDPESSQPMFLEGGSPQLAELHDEGSGSGEVSIDNARNLFGDVMVEQNAFSSAGITWGPDGLSIAVWATQWTGEPQAAEGLYPDPGQVYFVRATEPGGVTQARAVDGIDQLDLPEDARIIDVKISPTLRHLLVTVAYSVPGDLAAPRADLFLVEVVRDGPDDVIRLGDDVEGWVGPAAFSAPEPDSSQAP